MSYSYYTKETAKETAKEPDYKLNVTHYFDLHLFSDFTIEVPGRVFPCHLIVLCSRGIEYFNRLKDSTMKEMIERKVTFPDISVELMTLFLQYVYGLLIFTGSISVETTVELYDLGERFQYADLKKSATEHVGRVRNSSAENRAKGLMFDEKLNIKESQLTSQDLSIAVLIHLPMSTMLYMFRENRVTTSLIWSVVFQWVTLHDEEKDVDALLKYCTFKSEQDCIRASYIDSFISYAEVPSLRLAIIQGLKNNLAYGSGYNSMYYGSTKEGTSYQDAIKFKQKHIGTPS